MIVPDAEVAELTRRAQEGWQILKRGGEDFRYWIGVGQAIDAFRRQLFHDLKINEPKGQAYKEAMGAYLKQNGWNQPPKWKPGMTLPDGSPVAAPNLEQTIGIDDGVRANLQHVIDRLAEIDAWRATQPLGNVLRQNHPNTVWRAFQKAFPDPDKQRENGEKRRSDTARLREERNEATAEVARLQAEVEELTARAETSDAQAGYMWDKSPAEVAEKMVKHDPAKAAELAAEIFTGTKGFESEDIASGLIAAWGGEKALDVAGIIAATAGDEIFELVPMAPRNGETVEAAAVAAPPKGETVSPAPAAGLQWNDELDEELESEFGKIGVVVFSPYGGNPQDQKVGDVWIKPRGSGFRASEYKATNNRRPVWTLIPGCQGPLTLDRVIRAMRRYKGLSPAAPPPAETVEAPEIVTAGTDEYLRCSVCDKVTMIIENYRIKEQSGHNPAFPVGTLLIAPHLNENHRDCPGAGKPPKGQEAAAIETRITSFQREKGRGTGWEISFKNGDEWQIAGTFDTREKAEAGMPEMLEIIREFLAEEASRKGQEAA